MHLTLLHFNDLHARLDQLPRLSTLLQRQRQAARGRVLVLEGGDSSDREVWESDLTQGRANFALLAALGVDVSVVGNGEALQWGRGALARLVAAAPFPVLAANLVDLADPTQPAVPGLRAAHVFDLGGYKLGVLGLTADFGEGYRRFGYTAVDPIATTRRVMADLRRAGARTVIALSHLGYGGPGAAADDQVRDLALAEACPELAVIVGAHSHQRVMPPVSAGPGGTLIVQAGAFGEALGQLDLTLDPETGRVVAAAGQLHPCDAATPIDSALSATLELVREEAAPLREAQVAVAAHPWPHRLDAPSPWAALVAEAVRATAEADLAVIFSGLARTGLPAGPITRGALCASLSQPAHLTAAAVTGAQVWRLLNQMLASPWRTESFNPHRGQPPLGLPACSPNVTWAYDLARPAGDQVTEVRLAGAPLAPTGRYRLASTYTTLHPEAGDFVGLQPGQAVDNVRVEEVLWQVMERWLRDRGAV